ncbi:hypothetical protein [Actinomadura rugatobispora]|uniref:Uncharacterized protein n=1 Tax=Actinomadura rugatobispora TaxID=1994 RepID=A0ABW1A5M5_9ACTN
MTTSAGAPGEGRMRLRALARAVPGSRGPCRVLEPRGAPHGLWVCPPSSGNLGLIVGSRAGLLHLGAWFRMAAISPRSLVHLPVGGARPEGIPWYGPPEGSADLVIVRSDLGLRPSAWPGVRRRLPAGRPVTLRPPPPRDPADGRPGPPHGGLALAEPGRALLVSGPAALLLHTGDVISAAGEWIASDRDVHRHGWSLVDSLTGLLRDGGPAPRHPELDVVGADPLFHKSLRRKRAHARGALTSADRRAG